MRLIWLFTDSQSFVWWHIDLFDWFFFVFTLCDAFLNTSCSGRKFDGRIFNLQFYSLNKNDRKKIVEIYYLWIYTICWNFMFKKWWLRYFKYLVSFPFAYSLICHFNYRLKLNMSHCGLIIAEKIINKINRSIKLNI